MRTRLNISALRCALTLVGGCLVLASSARAQESLRTGPRSNARDVTLEIEVSRSTYRLGDSIYVRVTLRNNSGQPVRYTGYSPTGLARLRVLDAAGRPLKPTVPGDIVMSRGWETGMAGFENKVLRDDSGREWMNLRNWGYDLRTPGSYTIVGFPGLAGPRVTSDTTIRSDRVKITISP